MDIKELNKRLNTLINEFNDNIEDVPKIIYVTPVFPKPIDFDPEIFFEGKVKRQTYVKALNYEKFEEWKGLFNAYKELKGKIKGYKFKKKFKKLTEENLIYLFNPLLLNHREEFKEWREYS